MMIQSGRIGLDENYDYDVSTRTPVTPAPLGAGVVGVVCCGGC